MYLVSCTLYPDLEEVGKKLEKSLTVIVSQFDHWLFYLLSCLKMVVIKSLRSRHSLISQIIHNIDYSTRRIITIVKTQQIFYVVL